VNELFSSLSTTATAAASLGQVHRGVLRGTGEVVAVKVQRPNIRQLVDMDLSTIRFVIWVISWFVNTRDFIDLPAFYREFRRTILEEIDYVQEADNARRFRTMFDGQSGIFIPKVFDDYVSKRVLVLEWVDGIKVNDYPRLDEAGVSRFAVAKRTVEAYFYQFFEVGFFHADPHPGNIFVQPGPTAEEPTVAFVDFGMVGTLTRSSKQGLKNLFLGFVVNDPHAMVQALNRLGFIGEGANLAAIEYGVATMMDQYHGITLGQARDLNVSDVAHELEDLFYAQPFRIPAQFAFTGRARRSAPEDRADQDDRGQPEAEPARCHQLVDQQHRAGGQRRDRQQQPAEVQPTTIAIALVAAPATGAVATVLGEPHLELPGLDAREHAVDLRRQREQGPAGGGDLSQDLLDRLARAIGSQAEELLRVGQRHLEQVEVWRQAGSQS
jgi:predicted unusual protein kinase regulating ubiquinone biosynthesis (AarF/ABC1/UbiB family)